MRHSRFRTILLAGCAGMALSPAFALAQTQPQPRAVYNIPAQDLGTALTQFGQQSEREIVFSADLTRNRRARAVSGEMSTGEALAMLLGDSGLTYRTSPSGSIIVEASDPQSGSAAGDGADGTVQALIVTAQKREENIQDVPIAMSAFTQEDLTKSQVTGGPDLMTQVPNLTFTKTNFSGYSIQIRGIGTQAISATVDPAVAVAFNNTPFIRNRFFEQEFYDLERVEVLRGPQGTLYGRNATAGVVNIISAKPSHKFEAKVSADLGNYDSRRVEGMVNLPLAEDKLALRIAGAWTKRDGFVTNEVTGRQTDGRDLWSTRVSLGFSPTDRLGANLIWEHFEEDDDRLRSGKQLCKRSPNPTHFGNAPILSEGDAFGPLSYTSQGCEAASLYSPDSFQVVNGYALPFYGPLNNLDLPLRHDFDPYSGATQSRDLRVIDTVLKPEYRAKSDVVEFQFQVDLADYLRLVSETGYNRDWLFSFEDYNRFNTRPGIFDYTQSAGSVENGLLDANNVFCDPQLGCSDRLLAGDISTAKTTQFSQEFRVTSDFEGPFNFSLGTNFLRYNTVDKYYVMINTLSMYSAADGITETGLPYVAGVTDNTACLPDLRTADPSGSYFGLNGCRYMDPNGIHSLNDMGRNYFLSKNPYRLVSYALFGEAQYQITPGLKITAGLRWTVDKKHTPLTPSWLLAVDSYGLPVSRVINQKWSEPTGRLVVDWKPQLAFTDETLIYASYSHGYKAGGTNPPPPVNAFSNQVGELILATQPQLFRPEFVDAYEVGAKNTLLNGDLTLNGGIFYYDYRDYQISQIVNRSAVNLNFDAKVWGAELELDWRPVENLRLGFKGGYEKSRVADGESAVDMIDRTAGHTDWAVIKPFPTNPSNCILPVSMLEVVTNYYGGEVGQFLGVNADGVCSLAYFQHLDPVTQLPYVPDPTVTALILPAGYHGFNPLAAPNNGEGFSKDLGGNELPNTPRYTATVTADYTLPLPNSWLMTLHTDLYWQATAWARIFNMPGYDKLKAYSNVNLAAIFSNEDRGWQVMAYIKNVLDKDNITGAFLNSDDTGLTTNVFLNEPRLFGLRVTRQWSGNPWWSTDGHPSGMPWPLRIELGGEVERIKASNQIYVPAFVSSFTSKKLPFPLGPQGEDLDWGDGRSVKVTYQPEGTSWTVSAAYRNGRTNGAAGLQRRELSPGGYVLDHKYYVKGHYNYAKTDVSSREEHTLVDFAVGKDMGLGTLRGMTSRLEAGLRYGQFKSSTSVMLGGIPDYYIAPNDAVKYPRFHHGYRNNLDSERSFKGFGPMLSWEGADQLLGNDAVGRVKADWELGGGVLFGKQKTSVREQKEYRYYLSQYYPTFLRINTDTTFAPVEKHRSASATVPVLGASLGLSYEIERVRVSGGYRIDKFYNVIDGGIDAHKSYDRTIQGPYFKVSVGFGG